MRRINVYREEVGGPKGSEQDVVLVDVGYWKGHGYELSGKVVREDARNGLTSMAMFTGITRSQLLKESKRFNQNTMRGLACGAACDLALATMVPDLKAELARRIKDGEDY